MAKNYDELINAQQVRLTQLRAEMEGLKEQFISQVAAFLASWYPIRAKEIVRTDAIVAEKMGTDRMRELKHLVEQLGLSAPSLAKSTLSDPDHWWHLKEPLPTEGGSYRGEPIAGRYRFRQYDYPPALFKPVSSLVEELGALLHSFGFLQAGATRRSVAPRNLPWPKDVTSIMDQYVDKVSAGLRILSTIEQLQDEKRKASVADLWDSL